MQKQMKAPIEKATAYFLAPPTRQCQVAGTSSVLCTCLLTPFNVQLGHQSPVPSSAAPPFQFISASHGMPVSMFSIPPSLSVMPVSLQRFKKKKTSSSSTNAAACFWHWVASLSAPIVGKSRCEPFWHCDVRFFLYPSFAYAAANFVPLVCMFFHIGPS